MSEIDTQTGVIIEHPSLEFEMSAEIGELVGALAQARTAMANPSKSAQGNRGQYADLPAVCDAVSEALSKHDLIITQPTCVREGTHYLVTLLGHKSGQWMRGYCELNADDMAKGSRDQSLGSSMTYMRRYCLAAICGVAPGSEVDLDAPAITRNTGDYSSRSGRRPQKPERKKKAATKVDLNESMLEGEAQVSRLPGGTDWIAANQPEVPSDELTKPQIEAWVDKLRDYFQTHNEAVTTE